MSAACLSANAEDGKRDKRLQKRIDKSVESLLAESRDSGDEARLAEVCRMYAETVEDSKKLTATNHKLQQRIETLLKEKSSLESENSKSLLVRTRLEDLCRQLQKQNKQIKEENVARLRDEEERRREAAGKFQTTLSEISSLMANNEKRNVWLTEENRVMSDKLKELLNKYDDSNKAVELLMKQKDLEYKLAEARLVKSLQESAQEKKAMLFEKHTMLTELNQCQTRCLQLHEQLKMYSENYDRVQSNMSQSDRMISDFKAGMNKMQKNVKRMERETGVWKERCEVTGNRLTSLSATNADLQQRLAVSDRKILTLEKLCRALQSLKLPQGLPDDANSETTLLRLPQPTLDDIVPTRDSSLSNTLALIERSSSCTDTVPQESSPIFTETVPQEHPQSFTETVHQEPSPSFTETVSQEHSPISTDTVPQEPSPSSTDRVHREPSPSFTDTVPQKHSSNSSDTLPQEPSLSDIDRFPPEPYPSSTDTEPSEHSSNSSDTVSPEHSSNSPDVLPPEQSLISPDTVPQEHSFADSGPLEHSSFSNDSVRTSISPRVDSVLALTSASPSASNDAVSSSEQLTVSNDATCTFESSSKSADRVNVAVHERGSLAHDGLNMDESKSARGIAKSSEQTRKSSENDSVYSVMSARGCVSVSANVVDIGNQTQCPADTSEFGNNQKPNVKVKQDIGGILSTDHSEPDVRIETSSEKLSWDRIEATVPDLMSGSGTRASAKGNNPDDRESVPGENLRASLESSVERPGFFAGDRVIATISLHDICQSESGESSRELKDLVVSSFVSDTGSVSETSSFRSCLATEEEEDSSVDFTTPPADPPEECSSPTD